MSQKKQWIIINELRQPIVDELRTIIAKFQGKRLVLTLEKLKIKRSNNQNRYYWGVIIPAIKQMFDDAGNDLDSEEIHESLKIHIGKLRQEIKLPNGETKQIIGSTASLSTLDMELYLEKIRAWAAQFDYIIPLPNEVFLDSN